MTPEKFADSYAILASRDVTTALAKDVVGHIAAEQLFSSDLTIVDRDHVAIPTHIWNSRFVVTIGDDPATAIYCADFGQMLRAKARSGRVSIVVVTGAFFNKESVVQPSVLALRIETVQGESHNIGCFSDVNGFLACALNEDFHGLRARTLADFKSRFGRDYDNLKMLFDTLEFEERNKRFIGRFVEPRAKALAKQFPAIEPVNDEMIAFDDAHMIFRYTASDDETFYTMIGRDFPSIEEARYRVGGALRKLQKLKQKSVVDMRSGADAMASFTKAADRISIVNAEVIQRAKWSICGVAFAYRIEAARAAADIDQMIDVAEDILSYLKTGNASSRQLVHA